MWEWDSGETLWRAARSLSCGVGRRERLTLSVIDLWPYHNESLVGPSPAAYHPQWLCMASLVPQQDQRTSHYCQPRSALRLRNTLYSKCMCPSSWYSDWNARWSCHVMLLVTGESRRVCAARPIKIGKKMGQTDGRTHGRQRQTVAWRLPHRRDQRSDVYPWSETANL